MKALFGVVSLLVALALVALVATKQLRAVGSASAASSPVAPLMSASGAVRDQAQQLERRVGDDVAKAMQQGAAGRAEAEK